MATGAVDRRLFPLEKYVPNPPTRVEAEHESSEHGVSPVAPRFPEPLNVLSAPGSHKSLPGFQGDYLPEPSLIIPLMGGYRPLAKLIAMNKTKYRKSDMHREYSDKYGHFDNIKDIAGALIRQGINRCDCRFLSLQTFLLLFGLCGINLSQKLTTSKVRCNPITSLGL